MFIRQGFFVKIEDTGADGHLSDKAILEAMGNTATLHAGSVGQSPEEMDAAGLAWVITGWKLRVLARPRVFTSFSVGTWVREMNRVFAYRDFEAYDEEGSVIAAGSAVCVLIDSKKRVIARLTPALSDPYEKQPEKKAFGADITYADPRSVTVSPVKVKEMEIMRSMIDRNGHVHYSVYLDLAAEALPEECGLAFENVEISFKKEIRPREIVTLEYAAYGDGHCVFIRDGEDKTLHAMILLS